MTERLTDISFQNLFKKLANVYYNVELRPDLFGSLIPDGWFENDSNELFIIENKSYLDSFNNARVQLLTYKKAVKQLNNKYDRIYLLFGYNNGPLFEYKIFNSNMRSTQLRLEDLNLRPKTLPGLNALDSETTRNIVRIINHSKHKKEIIQNVTRMLNINNNNKEEDDSESYEFEYIDEASDETSEEDVIYLGRRQAGLGANSKNKRQMKIINI
ncbi:MAG: hypothetical protein LBE09_04890 [Christensenellaceae bacterium]|jgi:hypothetical protein|nr:hypothetical protein [Christensenellaceae bacterium]